MTGLMRSGVLTLILSMVGCGCKNPPVEQISASQDGRYVITREILGHCGGAVVSYRSELVVADSHPWGQVMAYMFMRGLPRPVVRWTGPRTVEIDVFFEPGEEVTKKFVANGDVKVTFHELREKEDAPMHVCCTVGAGKRSD